MLTATRDLLTSLEPLPYRERTRRLTAWARTAPDRAEVCADLRTQGPDERHDALLAATVARDTDGILAATTDPHPSIRAAAVPAALRAGIVPAGVADRSAADRRRIYRTLRQVPDRAVADGLIGEIRATFGDDEAVALLPACGTETVRALLPELDYALNHERLRRRHAGLLIERVTERLTGADHEQRRQIWARTGGAVVRCDPAAVLDLLERHAPEDALPGGLTAYGVLAAYDAGRVVTLLTAPGRRRWLSSVRLPPALLRRLVTLPAAQLAPLARALRDHGGFAALLDALPPARRAEVYEASLTEVDRSGYEPGPPVLEVLPAAVRIAEATRLLAKAKIRTEEEVRRLSAHLAWPDASAALQDGLRAGDAEERAVAWRLLVDAARRSRDPQVVAELVDRLGRLRNEQDPVRTAALNALAGTARLLSAAAAPGLTRLTTDAVDARDASATTSAALATLAADTLQHHVGVPELRDWALLTIDLVSTSATVPVLRRFDSVLRRGQEAVVFERLRGWIEASIARGRYAPLFAVTRALGRWAWRVPPLQDLLAQAAGPGTLPGVATEAITLWLADPRRRSDRVADVLAADPSAAALPPVWTVICTERTDLIGRVLREAPQGRFVDGKVRWVPGWAARPERWPARQRAVFVALLARIVADTGTEVWRRAGALRAAAPVPGAGRDLVLSRIDDPVVVIAEAALGALVWTDRPDEALPVLLRHAGGDRARVAMYAAGRAARYTPPSALPGLLGPVLVSGTAKVTSRKEAARLLARYGTAGALATLLAAYEHPSAHRDVRAAITSAARQRLDAPASWTILRTAGSGSREERRAVLAVGPYGVPDRFRPAYADLIAEACRTGDREVRRIAFTQLPAWIPWAPGLGGLIEDRLTDLTEKQAPYETGRLAAALDAEALLRAVVRLADREEADDRPGGPEADHPARRRLESLAAGTGAWVTVIPAVADRAAPIAAARRLATRPALTGIAVTMLIGLGELANLPEVADLCASRPGLAFRAQAKVRAGLRRLAADPDVLRERVAGLTARGDLAGGLFAVALISRAAVYDWPPAWRRLLTELRRHPDPDVREEAWSAVDMTDD